MTDGPIRVVIVGAGFAGLTAAKALRQEPVHITIVDRRNFHLFQPLLYQVAAAALNPSDIAYPIRSIFRRQENVRSVLLAEVTGIALSHRTVSLDDGSVLPYDYLILATGATHSYFGHDDWEQMAPGLKTLEGRRCFCGRGSSPLSRMQNATRTMSIACSHSSWSEAGRPGWSWRGH